MKTVYITGVIGLDTTAESFKNSVDFNSKESLRIFINSPGGLVSEGFEIYNLIKSYKGIKEVVLGTEVSSIASYIAMAVPLQRRKGLTNSSMMIHESSGGLIMGRARDLRTYSERLEGINNIMAEAYANGTGIQKEEVRAKMQEDYFITGWEELTDQNVISELIEPSELNYPEITSNTRMMDLESAKARMYAIEEKLLLDRQRSELEMEKAAAYLKPVEAQTESQTESQKQHKAPLVTTTGENKMTTEEVSKMSLQDYLNSHPEHKAEFENMIESAKISGAEKASADSAAVMAERSRIAEIISLSGVEVNATIAEAIDKGVDASDYAKAELLAQRNKREESKKAVFGSLVAKQTPGDQDTATASQTLAGMSLSDEAFEKRLKEGAEARKNGRLM